MIQWLRSLIFVVQMYVAMVVLAVVFLLPMIFHPRGAFVACKTYCRWVIWTAKWMVDLKTEVRGSPPKGEVMVAAKHQSFFDILIIFLHLPRARFIMKQELLYTPIVGQFAYRIGCVPVNRGKGAEAVKKMVADVQSGRSESGQLVIYPQGTRVPPGEKRPYKIGTAVLYEATEQACVPVAVNVGAFWPKRGIMRKPGTAVVEFLDPIEPGLPTQEFMERLEGAIEPASDRLLEEARL
ncbi:MAG: lysophospholipid acyltransferase family protein [Planktomarina sp.]